MNARQGQNFKQRSSSKWLLSLWSLPLLGLVSCTPVDNSFRGVTTSIEGSPPVAGQKSLAFDVNKNPLNKVVCDPFGGTGPATPESGIVASLFYVGAGGAQLHLAEDYTTKAIRSRQRLFFSDINVPTRMFSEGFATQTSQVVKDDLGQRLIEWFGIQFQTSLALSADMPEGDYELASLGDDGVIVKAKINGTWQTVINNDGDHPTKMGCSKTIFHFARNAVLPIELTYYQGPRYHISNVLMWRKTDAGIVGKDQQCGHLGNTYFFDPNKASQPLAPYRDLLARGWTPIGKDNFFLPLEGNYNPCVQGTDPVLSQFMVNEVFANMISVSWTTDIAATTQVLVTDLVTGEQLMSTTDNILRTDHVVRISGLKAQTEYSVQAVSISENLGKGLGAVVRVTTMQ